MKQNLFLWQFVGFTVSVALGTLLHFIFEWTSLTIFAPISAVNESTWEHMKILFFPMLFFALVQYVFFKGDYLGFWWIKLIGTIVGVLSIPVLFYTVSGVFGKTPDWLNIILFFISAFLGYLVEYHLFYVDFSPKFQFIGFIILILIASAFILFTFYTPKLPLFKDPLTGLYGMVNI